MCVRRQREVWGVVNHGNLASAYRTQARRGTLANTLAVVCIMAERGPGMLWNH